MLHRPPTAGIGIGAEEVHLGLVELRGDDHAREPLLGNARDHLTVVAEAPQHHPANALSQKKLRIGLAREFVAANAEQLEIEVLLLEPPHDPAQERRLKRPVFGPHRLVGIGQSNHVGDSPTHPRHVANLVDVREHPFASGFIDIGMVVENPRHRGRGDLQPRRNSSDTRHNHTLEDAPPAGRPRPISQDRRPVSRNPRNCFRNSTKKAREVKASRAMDDLPRTPGWVKPCDGGGST